jgi:glycosyltransferase involved in cell wall biosynthesis
MSRSLPKSFLVIDDRWPLPSWDSGSLRLFNLLLVLKQTAGQVTFGVHPATAAPKIGDHLRSLGIQVLASDGDQTLIDYLAQTGSRYDVIIASRPSDRAALSAVARRFAPQALLIFDTVDLHHLRLYRAATVLKNASLVRQALATKASELALVREADCTWVVSPVEEALLQRECPGSRIRVVSNIHDPEPTQTAFVDRHDLLFVGFFGHHPNVDAMLYFAREILPLVRQRLPGVRCHIVGGQLPPEVAALHSEELVVTGHVPDLSPYFEQCRLSIAPLRYGAGVKGKVLQSLSKGLPVVGTSMAAEGLYAQAGEHLLVADSPEEFAEAIQTAYTSEALWSRLARNGLRLIETQFSFAATRAKLAALWQETCDW